jgi:hypothetical protein
MGSLPQLDLIYIQDNKNKQLSALLKPLLNPPPIAIAKVHNPNKLALVGVEVA